DVWVPGDTGYIDFSAYINYIGDERSSNDSLNATFYVRPLRQLAGNISDTLSGNGVYARVYFQFADDTGAVYFDSTTSDSVTGDFSVHLIDSLYRAVVRARIPYPDMIIEDVYVTPDSISQVDVGTSPADLLIVNRDDQERYAEYYTVCLDTLGITYKIWAPSSQGLFPMSRIDEFNNDMIIWYTGRAISNTVTAAEQDSLMQFLTDGGMLLITGQNIGEEISASQFYTSWLHAQLVNDSIQALRCYPDTLDSLGQNLFKIFTAGSAPSQFSRDVIASDGSAHEFLFYDTLLTDCAAIWYSDPFPGYRIIYCAFGLEAVNQIPGHMSLTQLLEKLLGWFDIVPVQEGGVVEVTHSLITTFPNPVMLNLNIGVGPDVVGETGSVCVYDVAGRCVKRLWDGRLIGALSWDLNDDAGRKVANGVYFVSMKTSERRDIHKIVIVD
ncbi:MAG: T9SS type A sorting domain-containing protein, partial [candidate division WOR-3 bacterium]